MLAVWKALEVVESSSTASWDGRDLKRGQPSTTIQVLNFFCSVFSRWPLRTLQTGGICLLGLVPLLLRLTPFCPVLPELFYDWSLSVLM